MPVTGVWMVAHYIWINGDGSSPHTNENGAEYVPTNPHQRRRSPPGRTDGACRIVDDLWVL